MVVRYIYDDYAKWTDNVAQYPVTAENFYLALGIADEAGELLSCTRDEDVKEAGDVLWYVSRYATKVLGVNFSAVVEDALTGEPSLVDVGVHIGAICGVEKKRIRDGASWNAEKALEKTSIAYNALVGVVKWTNNILTAHNHTLIDAIELNISKLGARLEAGTIKGDGDHR
jgi:hypothetical protein